MTSHVLVRYDTDLKQFFYLRLPRGFPNGMRKLHIAGGGGVVGRRGLFVCGATVQLTTTLAAVWARRRPNPHLVAINRNNLFMMQ